MCRELFRGCKRRRKSLRRRDHLLARIEGYHIHGVKNRRRDDYIRRKLSLLLLVYSLYLLSIRFTLSVLSVFYRSLPTNNPTSDLGEHPQQAHHFSPRSVPCTIYPPTAATPHPREKR